MWNIFSPVSDLSNCVFVHVYEFDAVTDIQFCFLYNLYFRWNNNNKSTTTANIKHYTARDANLVYMQLWLHAANVSAIWSQWVFSHVHSFRQYAQQTVYLHCFSALRQWSACDVHVMWCPCDVHVMWCPCDVHVMWCPCDVHVMWCPCDVHVMRCPCDVHVMRCPCDVHVMWCLCDVHVMRCPCDVHVMRCPCFFFLVLLRTTLVVGYPKKKF